MSVAFRRESDEEHLEPKFEIPIPPGPNLVTARGLALIAGKVAVLEEKLSLGGDEDAVKRVKRELRYWQTRQITAEVVPAPAGGVGGFGAVVTFLLNGKENTLQIVGVDEADPKVGLISFCAPLARALMGAEAGEFVQFGGREDAIEVLTVTVPV